MARLEAMRCTKCDAQLDVGASDQRVQCAYCGISFRVARDPKGAHDLILQPIAKLSRVMIVIVACAGLAMMALFVFVMKMFMNDPPKGSVRYLSVQASSRPGHVGGHVVEVRIELETTSKMPHVAPFVKVAARCDGKSDEADAFFMELSNLAKGDQREDTEVLFQVDSFERPPERCDLTLTLERGSTPPAHYCYQGGKTTEGKCP